MMGSSFALLLASEIEDSTGSTVTQHKMCHIASKNEEIANLGFTKAVHLVIS